jgi:hypothetical protein
MIDVTVEQFQRDGPFGPAYCVCAMEPDKNLMHVAIVPETQAPDDWSAWATEWFTERGLQGPFNVQPPSKETE